MEKADKGSAAAEIAAKAPAERARRTTRKTEKPARSARHVGRAPKRKAAPPPKQAPATTHRRARTWSDEIAVIAWDYVTNHEKKPYLDPVPTVTGLAAHLGCGRRTLYGWAEQPRTADGKLLPYESEAKESLAEALDVLMSVQGRQLITKGLNGDTGSVITKLLLGHHGYAERLEASGPGGAPIPVAQTNTTIPENATAEQAAEVYRLMLQAGRGGAK